MHRTHKAQKIILCNLKMCYKQMLGKNSFINEFKIVVLYATNKLHLSTYHRTPSGNPCGFSLSVLHYFLFALKASLNRIRSLRNASSLFYLFFSYISINPLSSKSSSIIISFLQSGAITFARPPVAITVQSSPSSSR